MTDRYGRVKFSTIYAAKNELRKLIQSEGTPAIQAAWDRLEQWIDSPPLTPTNEDRPMTRPKPTIPEAYAQHRAAFIKRGLFGVLLKDDMRYLLKATARDAGVTVQEVLDAIDCPPRTGRAAGPLDRSVTHG